jgi:ABC-2 type transport system ATP-binding protein
LRLAFGVSTAVQPDIILLDEMISVGDAGFAAKAKERLDSLVSAAGILVFASHSHAALRQYCKTAIALQEGRIVAHGRIDDVLAEVAKSAA